MGKKTIRSLWNRENLLDINNNFNELYEKLSSSNLRNLIQQYGDERSINEIAKRILGDVQNNVAIDTKDF